MRERVSEDALPDVQRPKRRAAGPQVVEQGQASRKRSVRSLQPRARRAAATEVRTLNEIDQARRDDIIKHFRRKAAAAKNPRQRAEDRRAARTNAVADRKTENKMRAHDAADAAARRKK